MRIAAFMGNGSIAREFLKLIEFRSHQVIVFGWSEPKNFDFVKFEFCNFLSKSSFVEKLEKFIPDVVLCSTWCHRQEGYKYNQENFLYAEATLDLYRFCQQIHVPRFIVIGTSDEYDMNKSNLYALAKRQVSNGIKNISQDKESFCMLRPFTVYGKNAPDFVLIEKIRRAINEKTRATIFWPNSLKDWITSRDVAQAYLLACENELYGEYDVGSGHLYSVRSFIETVASHFRIPSSQFVDYSQSSETYDSRRNRKLHHFYINCGAPRMI